MSGLYTIAVIGAGNGGQAMAAHLSSMGHRVRIYNRDTRKLAVLVKTKKITLTGALQLEGEVETVSDNLEAVVKGADLIMVATTATAHRELAEHLSPFLEEGQMIVLNPGRTCGALEFRNVLYEKGLKERVYVAEAQTLVYACRKVSEGIVNVIGVKDRVLVAAYPSSDAEHVMEVLKPLYPCFYPASNVLQTSFENIGAIFHPCVVLFNEASIERGEKFYFYRDMTEGLARMIEKADKERLAVAEAYGINPISAFEWVSYAYNGVEGNSLCERMQNNPAYYEILAPKSIYCRQITEDIPMGIIPFAELGKVAGVPTPLFDSLITMCSILLERDFMAEGRTLDRIGLGALSKEEILKKIV